MRTQVVTAPSILDAAWSNQYERIAQIFASALREKSQEIVEIGCGSGQLTIPLAQCAPKLQFVLVDIFAGPRGSYSKRRYRSLLSNLRYARVTNRARIVVSDAMKWFSEQGDERYDAVISSEFLPEIDSAETSNFIHECCRLLKPRGVTAHSFLSPVPRNSRQKFVIEADSNPRWTRSPPKEWFSPKPGFVIKELRKSGFQGIRKMTIRSHLIVKAVAAKSLLKGWEVKASFYETHKKQLNKGGLEIPDWVIVSGIK